MLRLRIIRNLRTAGFLLAMLLVTAVIATLIWANTTGLPESWRIKIEKEISKHGTHVKIGSLSYHPLRGIIARQVRVFSDPGRLHEISRVEGLTLDFDNTRLTKGEFKLSKLVLDNATLSLPIHEDAEQSETLEITQANGVLLLHGKDQIEIRNASGMVEGISLTLNAKLTTNSASPGSSSQPQHKNNRLETLSRILRELKHWQFDQQQPPRLDILIDGNLRNPKDASATLNFNAIHLEKNQYRLDSLSAAAEITGNVLTVTSLAAHKGSEHLSGHIDYDLNTQAGRFDLNSSLAIPQLLESWLGLPPLHGLEINGKQEIIAEGEFSLPDGQAPRFHLTGKASGESGLVHDIPFDHIESAFSWRNGDLFLKDVIFKRKDGTAHGKILIQPPLVRIQIDSTIPAAIYQPLFNGNTTSQIIAGFSTTDDSSFHIRIEGGYDMNDPLSWTYTGSGDFKKVLYKGVPLSKANCEFCLSHHQQSFTRGSLTFDYSNYPLANQHGGAKTGNVNFEQINYRGNTHTVSIKQVTGTAWPAPIVRLFAPTLADNLERYRFHQPPKLNASGTIVTHHEPGTNLEVNFTTDSSADYELLGADIRLGKPTGTVLINSDEVTIKDLKADVFKGDTCVNLNFLGNGLAKHDIQWTKLDMNEISKAYKLNTDCGGEITGRMNFNLTGNKLQTMNGQGHFALENTELFSVPIFGPLSPLISGVLGDKRAGFERAKSAFCSFVIKDGVMATDDFQTSTTSLVFTGDGWVDLTRKTIDMTMRLNAKGLLGIITLPFRPFYGMFQFRGTGPINQVVWENVMFTQPNEKQKNILESAPKATAVGPDGAKQSR